MNEEQAVLDFFAKKENLPLGLSVAEQMDRIRAQMNNVFWQELLHRINTLIEQECLSWKAEPTEDRNAPDILVGLYCTPRAEQPLCLRPMAEQQYLGGVWRIYFGLMWSTAPAPEQLGLPDVARLKVSLQNARFKANENFLAWQWTKLYPRSRDFLMRFSLQTDKLLDDAEEILKPFLIERRDLLEQANSALQAAPRSIAISLNRLRSKRIR